MNKCIYCLGDSNTFGYDPRSPLGDRYPEPWCELLQKALGCQVYCDGLNGRSIGDVLRAYDILRTALLKQQPSELVILLGTNDILMDGLSEPQAVAERMDALLSRLRGDFPEMPIFLLSPPEIRIPGFLQWSSSLSGHYQALSQRYGTRFLSLAALSLPLAFDGVHLTEEGHLQLARILAAFLK